MESALQLFQPATREWFLSAIGQPTAVQQEGWPVIAGGQHALISAPTGTGKTLTAFLWYIDKLNRLAARGKLLDQVYVIYISPLKSLGNDIRANLKRPIDGLNSTIRTAVRNGDTTPKERRDMIRKPPHILLTTPESLYLLLTSQSGRRMLETTEAVILDELHALIDDKRGVHMMLSLERLNALCGREVQRIGLSATIRPLDRAAGYLAGTNRPVQVVAPAIQKQTEVTVRVAAEDMRVLPEHSIWPEICREIYYASQTVRTVLVFCQGRATAEKVAHGVNTFAEQEGYARTHHGSMSKEQRLEAENQLRAGQLRVLSCTSSMELGIDVGEVDLVVQVGVPQTVASAVQRLGRAGHQPGAVSTMVYYPRTHQDLLLAVMSAQSVRDKAIEEIAPPHNCLDILSQHLVSMAAAQPYSVQDAFELVTQCDCYRDLRLTQLEAVLKMLAGDYEHAQDRPVSPRIHYDRIGGQVTGSKLSSMLALSSGGTIPDRGLFSVVLEDGSTRLGELDEEYVFEARLGDKFMLGTFSWQILAIERERVVVRPSTSEGAQTPFWKGDGMDRPYETGLRFGRMLEEFNRSFEEGRLVSALRQRAGDINAAMNLTRYIGEQIEAVGCLHNQNLIVEEHFSNETGEHLMMLHSVFGGLVNRGVAILLKDAVEQLTGGDVRIWHDDDGILIHLLGGGEIPPDALSMIDAKGARTRLAELMPSSAMFNVSFRYSAGRALMMGVRPGGRVPLWVQRIRAAEGFARALDYPSHPLLQETMRECMEQMLDIDGVLRLLADVRSGKIRIVRKRMKKPSPMTIVLRQAQEAEMMYEYDPVPSGSRGLIVQMEENALTIQPEAQFVEAATGNPKPPADREQLHDRLMIEGDAAAGEIEAPGEWLEYLAAAGRALYIEPGLWIAAEQQTLYEGALMHMDVDDQLRIARRCLRFRGPMDEFALADRYLWSVERARELLERLVDEGIAVHSADVFIHKDVYERAQRMTISARRREIVTAPGARYASLLAHWQKSAGSPADQLAAGIAQLAGYEAPLDHWEGVILPARAPHYRPRMLDELLARGAAVWRLIPGDRVALSFENPEDVDWEADPPECEMSEAARGVYRYLSRRGASFAHAMAASLTGAALTPALEELVELGLLRCDSFAPLRKREAGSARQRVQGRIQAQNAGRWELSYPVKQKTMAERIERAFERWAIVCRETASQEGIDWRSALEALRRMEYSGEIRRGYFVEGLSGAQFVRKGDFSRVTARLAAPDERCACFCAADPAQAWGRVLPLPEGVSFMCVPGTAVVTQSGEIALIVERQGAVLRCLRDEAEAYTALVSAFRQEQIYPGLRSMTIKQYPASAEPRLVEAGFVREMRDYVMWR